MAKLGINISQRRPTTITTKTAATGKENPKSVFSQKKNYAQKKNEIKLNFGGRFYMRRIQSEQKPTTNLGAEKIFVEIFVVIKSETKLQLIPEHIIDNIIDAFR